MRTRAHPPVELLGDYAAGLLDAGFGLVVGAHVEDCAECRARLRALEAASGDALAQLPDAEIASDALARVMARLDVPATTPGRDRRPLLERLPLKRRRWAAPGVWVAAVDTPHAPQDRVYLVSSAPRTRAALHGHAGIEYCAVLQGGFRDGRRSYWAGDFIRSDAGVRHQPVAVGRERCVCLFATEGRLQPDDLIGWLAFRLAGV